VSFLLDFFNAIKKKKKKTCLFIGGGNWNLMVVQSMKIRPNIMGVKASTINVLGSPLNVES
jgi:hypothetical protein